MILPWRRPASTRLLYAAGPFAQQPRTIKPLQSRVPCRAFGRRRRQKPDCQRPHILRGAVQGGKIIGGLGVSGDTACADHEITKRVRDPASINLAGGTLAHDIV
jgi:hypothetical protein